MSNTANDTKSTETVTNDVFQDVVDKYAKADKGDKARIRTNANKKALSALSDGNFALATKWNNTAKALVTDKPDTEVDFGQIVANATFVLNGMKAAIDAFKTEHNITDVPEVTDNEALSAKSDKLVKSLLSVRNDKHDIQGVYDRAFENDAIGTVRLVADIANKGALPDYKPGSGAVAARLRGDEPRTLTDSCTLSGFEPVWVEKDGTVHTELAVSPTGNVAARKVA